MIILTEIMSIGLSTKYDFATSSNILSLAAEQAKIKNHTVRNELLTPRGLDPLP